MNSQTFHSLSYIGHNISEDNLLFSNRHFSGTLVAPSFFVTKAGQDIGEFGNIVLIPNERLTREIITYTHSADMMTPHLRQVLFDIPNREAIEDLVKLFTIHGSPILELDEGYGISVSKMVYILEGGSIHAFRNLKREPLASYVFARMIDCAPVIHRDIDRTSLETYLYKVVEDNLNTFKSWVDDFSIPLLGAPYITTDNGCMESLATPEHLLHFTKKDFKSRYSDLWGAGMAKASLAELLGTKEKILEKFPLIGDVEHVEDSVELVDDLIEEITLFLGEYTDKEYQSPLEFYKAVGEYVLGYTTGRELKVGLRELLTDLDSDPEVDETMSDAEWGNELEDLLMDVCSAVSAMKVMFFESKLLRVVPLSEFKEAVYIGTGEPRPECVELLELYEIPLKINAAGGR